MITDFDDEFMETLDEIHGNIRINKSFQFKGKRYALPKVLVDNSYELGKMTLSLNGYSLETDKNNQVLFSNGAANQRLLLRCNCDHWEACSEEQNTVYAFLFKEGQSDPICMVDDIFNNESTLLLEICSNKSSFESGKYFFYFPFAKASSKVNTYSAIHKGLCYAFEIFALGNASNLPRVSQAKVVSENEANTTGRFKLTIDLMDSVKEACELSILCYDDNYTLMSTVNKIVTSKSAASHTISFYLESEKIWTAGNYHVVLSKNRFPFMQIEVDASDFTHISSCIHAMKPEEDLHWIVSSLEYNKWSDWNVVREFNGLKQEKFKIARLLRSYFQDNADGKKRDSDLIVVESDSNLHSKFMSFALRHMFDMGRKSFKLIDLNPMSKEKAMYRKMADHFLSDRKNGAFVFTHINTLFSVSNRPLLSNILAALSNPEEQTTIVLSCTKANFATFQDLCPEIKQYVKEEQIFHLDEVSPIEKMDLFVRLFKEKQCLLSNEAQHALLNALTDCWERCNLKYISKNEASTWVQHIVYEKLCASDDLYACDKPNAIRTIEADALDLEDFFRQNPPTEQVVAINTQAMKQAFHLAMTELDNMIGLKKLKTNLVKTCKKVMFSKQREMLGLPVSAEPPHHMIFCGNPGTGKTTVAKLMGKIYKAMGLLSDGDVIVTERSKLVGQYIGETEQKMVSLLEEAKGKVLFIDEAYSLFTSENDSKDYGNQVVNSLLTTLAEPHSDMLIILAGYADDMERLLSKNHGLKSRFSSTFVFEDYSSDELYEIAQKELANGFYHLSPEADTCLRETIQRMVKNKQKDFGNARWVLQFVNHGILSAMANRVIDAELDCTIELYTQITKDDVLHAASSFASCNEPKNSGRIGFVR